MRALDIRHIIECGPGKVLAGMVKRIDAEAVTATVFDPASLAEAQGCWHEPLGRPKANSSEGLREAQG